MTMEENGKKVRLNDSTVGEHSINNNPTSEILNDDCLLHIFEYLPISDRIRLERVSKRWSALSKKSWQRYNRLTFTNDLWGCQNDAKITKIALKKVLHRCGKYLKKLDMSATPVLAETFDISSLLKLCPNLTSADFRSVDVGRPFIRSLVKHCKNIIILNFGWKTRYVTTQLINDTILSTYTHLRILELTDLDFREGFIEFKNKDTIQELCLTSCIGINMHSLLAVSQLRNLHTLSLKYSLHAYDLNFIKLPNLVKLDISGNYWPYIDDSFFIKLTSSCRGLKSLNVSGNIKITDIGLRPVISSNNLESLEINNLRRVRGSSLSDLPYLKRLSCQYCGFVKDVHFQTLFATSEKLEYVDLKGIKDVGSIIRKAVENVKFRTNDIPLVMLVNEVDVSITDVPDNLKLIQDSE